MPREGWKSITVTAEVYDYFWDQWQKQKEECRLKNGITSFSGFLTRKLYDLMIKEKSETN